ncbi:uncharacterized protein B0H64DRAFT_324781 [Chaetomium fimeti]|uniref:Transmembrane protein n=1 Tax=Chaetomium fimeti TaxID=1854472 RepID=A0AAE0HD94_9PEZI|nr:hypothetical protein B0H64DRAFT_324781 [Chaetomium fimeti]
MLPALATAFTAGLSSLCHRVFRLSSRQALLCAILCIYIGHSTSTATTTTGGGTDSPSSPSSIIAELLSAASANGAAQVASVVFSNKDPRGLDASPRFQENWERVLEEANKQSRLITTAFSMHMDSLQDLELKRQRESLQRAVHRFSLLLQYHTSTYPLFRKHIDTVQNALSEIDTSSAPGLLFEEGIENLNMRIRADAASPFSASSGEDEEHEKPLSLDDPEAALFVRTLHVAEATWFMLQSSLLHSKARLGNLIEFMRTQEPYRRRHRNHNNQRHDPAAGIADMVATHHSSSRPSHGSSNAGPSAPSAAAAGLGSREKSRWRNEARGNHRDATGPCRHFGCFLYAFTAALVAVFCVIFLLAPSPDAISRLRPETVSIRAKPFPVADLAMVSELYANASDSIENPHRDLNVTLALDAPGLVRVNVASWLPETTLYPGIGPPDDRSRKHGTRLPAEKAPFIVDYVNVTVTLEMLNTLWPVLLHAATDLLAAGLDREHPEYPLLRGPLFRLGQKNGRDFLTIARRMDRVGAAVGERGGISLRERIAGHLSKDGIVRRTETLNRALHTFHSLRLGLRPQSWMLANMATKMLRACALQDELRQHARSLDGNQSAWWHLEWDDARETADLAFVTFPPVQDTIRELRVVMDQIKARRSTLSGTWYMGKAVDELKNAVLPGWIERLGLGGLPLEPWQADVEFDYPYPPNSRMANLSRILKEWKKGG